MTEARPGGGQDALERLVAVAPPRGQDVVGERQGALDRLPIGRLAAERGVDEQRDHRRRHAPIFDRELGQALRVESVGVERVDDQLARRVTVLLVVEPGAREAQRQRRVARLERGPPEVDGGRAEEAPHLEHGGVITEHRRVVGGGVEVVHDGGEVFLRGLDAPTLPEVGTVREAQV
ncbi:MAG: hypothetical protein IT373_15245, partial [Polyangiaceae bacterium]|nr:hypothetical protein [Polyangiaceae bacterium]